MDAWASHIHGDLAVPGVLSEGLWTVHMRSLVDASVAWDKKWGKREPSVGKRAAPEGKRLVQTPEKSRLSEPYVSMLLTPWCSRYPAWRSLFHNAQREGSFCPRLGAIFQKITIFLILLLLLHPWHYLWAIWWIWQTLGPKCTGKCQRWNIWVINFKKIQ